MSHELIMDISKELFKLDKDVLEFVISASMISKLSSVPTRASHLRPLSELKLTITNLTSEYIAFRIKTTKKDYYAVEPTYGVLTPNGEQKIKITYYGKTGVKPNSKDHKFRVEGFIIPEEQKNETIKDLFQEYIKKEIKVSGNSIKLHAKFTEEDNANDKINELEPVKEEEKEILRESVVSTSSAYTVPEGQKSSLEDNNSLRLSDLISNNNNKSDLSDKEKLENLKNEYNQLKEEVENLKRNEETLNKKIRNEKNKKNIVPQSEIFRFNVPEVKEKPFSRNILIGIFVFSALIGFYLIK